MSTITYSYDNNKKECTCSRSHEELRNTGLYNRYVVTKANGNPVDPNAKYFVLRVDKGGKCKEHVSACREALCTFAHYIRPHNEALCNDILKFLYDTEGEKK